ncbi:MAG: transaldolase family protein, partial [bacterium]
TVLMAKQIVQWAQQRGLDKRRILIKIASTWEGIQAAKILETQGIACNCTLIFHAVQALACAQAGATLISPFVGRIYDWYKSHNLWHEGEADPGVTSVAHIFHLLKSQGYTTEVMGASFRNIDEILALAGCDRLTIAPKFLQQLAEKNEPLTCRLVLPNKIERTPEISEKDFRWQMNQDAMATEKLAEGIRLFAKDGETLCARIKESC